MSNFKIMTANCPIPNPEIKINGRQDEIGASWVPKENERVFEEDTFKRFKQELKGFQNAKKTLGIIESKVSSMESDFVRTPPSEYDRFTQTYEALKDRVLREIQRCEQSIDSMKDMK